MTGWQKVRYVATGTALVWLVGFLVVWLGCAAYSAF